VRSTCLSLLVLGALAAGCGSQTVTTTADSTGAPGNGGASTPTPPPASSQPTPPTPAVANVGSTIVLKGDNDGEQITATLLAVVDPAHAGSFFRPDKGKRFVGVQMKLTNSGTAVYSDSPSNGAAIIDKGDHQWQADIGEIEPDLGSPKMAPGESRVGFMTFELPKGEKPAKFQLTLDSGFADQTGEWQIDKTAGHAVDVSTSSGGTPLPSAKVGDAITLQGYSSGEKMKVTVLKVVDPASGGQYMTPESGKRFVGIEIKLANVGTKNYSDSPSNGASVVDVKDHELQADIGEVEPDIGSPKIVPGDARVGFLTFQVPKGMHLRTFQFTLDSGFADQTGEWSLGG